MWYPIASVWDKQEWKYLCYCLLSKPTRRAWSSGMPSHFFLSDENFPFSFLCCSFSCRSAACVCFSQKAEVNCLAGEQTAVAITGSETENARMLIGQRKQSTVVITGSGVKIDCVQLIKIILKALHIQSRTSTTSFYFWNLGIGKFHHHHLFTAII